MRKIILLSIILLTILIPSLAFSTSVSLDDTRQNTEDQTVFFTVTHNGLDYQYSADIPLSSDPLAHIQLQVDVYMNQIYREMYRKAPNTLSSTALWEAWIASGHKIKVKDGKDNQGNQKWKDRVIEKKEFKGKHPKKIQIQKDYDEALSDSDRIDILKRAVGLK